MRIELSTRNRLTLARILAIVAALVWITPQVRADWGGSLIGSATSTNLDSNKSTSIDQEYFLHGTGQPTRTIRWSLNGMYRNTQSVSNYGDGNRTEEWQPSGALHWSTDALGVRADGSLRESHDNAGSANVKSHSAGLFAQTNLYKLPRVFGSINWAKNVNDLDLIGYDTRTRNISGGANYTTNRVFGSYSYSNMYVANGANDIRRSSDTHNGKLDYSISPVKRLVNLQASYQIASRAERDHSDATVQSLIVLPASAGLYLEDAAPDFDALEGAPGLIDGLLEVAANVDYDLVNGDYHNLGLDFGAPTDVDHLHLYLDTLAMTSQTWTLWTSGDNLNWTRFSTALGVQFNGAFRRIEFEFEQLNTRYIKLAPSPLLQVSPIRVSELRGLVTRLDRQATDRSTDHRGTARMNFTPAKWLQLEVGGEGLRQSSSQVTLARDEDILLSSFHFVPSELCNVTGRYQWSVTRYPSASVSETENTSQNVAIRSGWSRALTSTASVERREERVGSPLSRRGDYARVELNALLLPALRGSTQLSYSEDERFDNPDKLFARSMYYALDGEPTPRSQMSVSYRYDTFSARVSAPHPYRSTIGGRLSYRLTDAISFTTDVSATQDPTRDDQSIDMVASWMPTNKLSLGASLSTVQSNVTESVTLYSTQAIFRWTARTEVSGSLSVNETENLATATTSRVSLFTRF